MGRMRMRNRRNDPVYREKERSKDRERRWVARQTKPDLRLREKERDREHKRNQKSMKLAYQATQGLLTSPTSPSISHEVEIEDQPISCASQVYDVMEETSELTNL